MTTRRLTHALLVLAIVFLAGYSRAALGIPMSPQDGTTPQPSAASVETSTTPAKNAKTSAKSSRSSDDTAPVDVNQIAFATGISSMTPVGSADSFDTSVGSVFFWNRLVVRHVPMHIKHVWYHDGEKVAEFPLTLRYAHTRVWTYKRIKPGQWRVDITDEQGTPIMTGSFIVREAPSSSQ